MKGVELYGQVRRAVYVEGVSRRKAARRFGLTSVVVVKKTHLHAPESHVQ